MDNLLTTSLTFGRFNLPHPGHVDLIRKMLEVSDRAVVGVSTGKANNDIEMRMEVLDQLCYRGGLDMDRVTFMGATTPYALVDEWITDPVTGFTDLAVSRNTTMVLGIDQSVLGWKEYELEVVRDRKDNCIIVCGIENIDPMGVHTGDSVTVAPIMTLSDKEYQRMRDAAFAIMRAVGVQTGGSNVQFGICPETGEMVVIEMNPRVSRSSALASKATGFPIARIAAKLAVGYSLDELTNDITGNTSACFEPSIDYVVVKMPRWTFEKFPEADERLTTQMKSVGEAMSIGRTFQEALQKAIRSMEVKRFGLGLDRNDRWLAARRDPVATREDGSLQWPIAEETIARKLSVPSQGRLYYVRYAIRAGWSNDRIHQLSGYDRWFIDQIREIVEFEDTLCGFAKLEQVPRDTLFREIGRAHV